MDNNTLKWVVAGVAVYLLFLRKKEDPTPEIVEIIKDVDGCMDDTADNYNAEATIDDGSCTYPQNDILGCTDATANNYDATATLDDGGCTYPQPISGCTDPIAANYDPLATIDDGQCVVPVLQVSGCTDSVANNYNAQATTNDNSCTYTEVDCWSNCPTPQMTSSVQTVCPATHPNLTQPVGCLQPITGCQDNTAVNYNPSATIGCS